MEMENDKQTAKEICECGCPKFEHRESGDNGDLWCDLCGLGCFKFSPAVDMSKQNAAWQASVFATDKFSKDLRRKNTVREIFNEGYTAAANERDGMVEKALRERLAEVEGVLSTTRALERVDETVLRLHKKGWVVSKPEGPIVTDRGGLRYFDTALEAAKALLTKPATAPQRGQDSHDDRDEPDEVCECGHPKTHHHESGTCLLCSESCDSYRPNLIAAAKEFARSDPARFQTSSIYVSMAAFAQTISDKARAEERERIAGELSDLNDPYEKFLHITLAAYIEQLSKPEV